MAQVVQLPLVWKYTLRVYGEQMLRSCMKLVQRTQHAVGNVLVERNSGNDAE